METTTLNPKGIAKVKAWRQDWCLFASEALGANLDDQQKEIVRACQTHNRVAVASGTGRGKDFVMAVVAICYFLWKVKRKNKTVIENCQVFLTGPTSRQVKDIMTKEWRRLRSIGESRIGKLPGRLVAEDIRTDNPDWFLTGFKSEPQNIEAWTGLHAAHIMFGVTEGSGIDDRIFNAIEGNLTGDSLIFVVFNPNNTTGYAAKSMKDKRWKTFQLNSLDAPNVIAKKQIIPGAVDYEWIKDKLQVWATPIEDNEVRLEEDDFQFEDQWYRPSDICRIKVLGKFPKVDSDVIIPEQWIEAANERWLAFDGDPESQGHLKLGVDVAGQGRDSSCFFGRRGNYTELPKMVQSGGEFMHMEIAGRVKHILDADGHAMAFIDTIGEGAGVYARLKEQGVESAVSAKFSHGAIDPITGYTLTDITEEHQFLNMRAYLYWALKDWLNPQHNPNAMLPPDDELKEELINTKWKFNSQGKIQIEAKEDIKKRIGRSPDKADALVNTFYPEPPKAQQLSQYF